MQTPDVNRPEVAAEVEAVFKEYERALTEDTVQDLTGLFRDNPLTLRDRGNALRGPRRSASVALCGRPASPVSRSWTAAG